jgi:hypothetical protein
VSTQLPPQVLAKADLRGNEYAWRPEDFLDALSDAASRGLACIGGQFQFRVPDGTCEMYWLSADPADRAEREKWSDYVARSEREVRERFTRMLETVDFRREAQNFEHLQQKIVSADFNLMAHLCFVAYFVDEHDQCA